MEKIIEQIDCRIVEEELQKVGVFKYTNKADNELYVVTADSAPHTLREIGRLREYTFREAGGGTGKSCDLDAYDSMSDICRQLIVWNPERKEIVGGYRFIKGADAVQKDSDELLLTSAHLFDYSEEFRTKYLPTTIELGRSFVRPEYQSALRGHKSLYALDNLWDGLGGLITANPETEYFFGKATIYPSFGEYEFALIQFFLNLYFADKERLITPKRPMKMNTYENFSNLFSGNNFKQDYVSLKKELKTRGKNIPPLVNAYMTLSPTMRVFGATLNDEFGDVYETGLMIAISEIYDEKKERHL